MRRASGVAAVVLSIVVLGLLAALHVVSPEFDPSWRVVSEYANGQYGWMLALMFSAWALGSWALAYALWPQVSTRWGKVGLWILLVAGAGQALAAAFDVNQPLHGLADLLGGFGLPVAAMLVSVSLVRTQAPLHNAGALLWLANLSWVSMVATVAGVALLFLTYVHAGGHVPADGKPLPLGTVLPAGVIAVVGFANRLYVVVSCFWAIDLAGQCLSAGRLEKCPAAARSTV